MAQRMTLTSRMMVPARTRKTLDRSSNRSPREVNVGQRYDGISSRKGVRPLFRMEDFSSRAVTTAARNPNTYSPSIAAARAESSHPSSGRRGMNAAMIRV